MFVTSYKSYLPLCIDVILIYISYTLYSFHFVIFCEGKLSVIILGIDMSTVVLFCVVIGVQKAFIANNIEGEFGSPSSLSSMEQVLAVAQAWDAEYFVAVRDYTIYPSDFFSREVYSVSQS